MTDTVQVPREATPEMEAAGHAADAEWSGDHHYGNIWKAMLAAAPQAPDPRSEIERLTQERDDVRDKCFGCITPAEHSESLIAAQAENEKLRAALEYYASNRAWTVSELEGPYGDYGKRARTALTTQPSKTETRDDG